MKEKGKRAAILKAAAAVFAAKGFHSATVEEIAAHAGVGKGTVYEYFSSKEELFREMLKAGMKVYLAAVRERLDASASAREILTGIARAHLAFVAEHGALARLLFEAQGVPAPSREWFGRVREQKLAVLTKIIGRGMARGEFRPVDPSLAAQIFLGVLGSLCLPLLFGLSSSTAGARTPPVSARAGAHTSPARVSPGAPVAPSDLRARRDLQSRLEQGLDIFFSGLIPPATL